MAKFDMSDYVDVAERVREFYEKYPEGSLMSEMTRMDDGWLCKAFAHRNPTDLRPGVGHAFEPVPGKTPYTKDSEAMNAETSAWGRAIVACGFPTKKIASADEVRNRQGEAKDAAVEGQRVASSTASEGDLTAKILAAADIMGVKDATDESIAASKAKRTPEDHLVWLGTTLKAAEEAVKQFELQAAAE